MVLQCPNPLCELVFQTSSDIQDHLNHPVLSCANRRHPECYPMTLECNPANSALSESQDSQANVQTSTINHIRQYHPNSGWTFGRAPNVFEQMNENKYAHHREHNLYWPFQGSQEWGLAKFLNETLNLTQIDKFLKLDWASQVQACSMQLY